MAIDFPNSPTNGQTYTSGTKTWTYDSSRTKWVLSSISPDSGALTTKGDILTRTSSALTRVAVGSNNQVLTADSAQTAGVKWATPVTVATDTLWDAKGDLAVGSGADTAARLAVGSNNHVLMADSSQTLGIKWANPGAWTSYTPSWTALTTNPAVGNGTLWGYHCRIGDLVNVRVGLKMGSTTTYGSGVWYFSLPITGAIDSTFALTGYVHCFDTSTGNGNVGISVFDGSNGDKIYMYADGVAEIKSTVPFTWASGDWIQINCTYRAA